jgi:hypothetical protein
VTPASQKPDEGSSECSVEDRVDDRVDCRGHISQPETRVHHVIRNVAVWTRREDYVEDEERRPTQDESEEDQTQHFGRLLFRGYCICGKRASFVPAS